MVVRRSARHNLTWAERDATYKARGRAKAVRYSHRWEGDLKEQNRGKVGHPFQYSDSMMAAIALGRIVMDVSYRDYWGQLSGAWGDGRTPHYSTMWRRAGNVMPAFQDEPEFTLREGVLRVVVDSTGVANFNRGEWIRVQWNVRRGFFKLHILVDLDTRRILAFAMSDMNGGDAAHLPVLLNNLMKKYTGEGIPLKEPIANLLLDGMPARAGGRADPNQTLLDRWMSGNGAPRDVAGEIVLDEEELRRAEGVMGEKLRRIRNRLARLGIHMELRADGGYDAREIFSLLARLGITPVIRICIDANARSKGVDRARGLAVLEQFGGRGGCTNTELNRMTRGERRANQKAWKEDVGYGLRWIVEIVISAFKRVFGESVRALKPHTAIIEIATKIAAYNRNLDIGDAAVRAMRPSPDAGRPDVAGGRPPREPHAPAPLPSGGWAVCAPGCHTSTEKPRIPSIRHPSARHAHGWAARMGRPGRGRMRSAEAARNCATNYGIRYPFIRTTRPPARGQSTAPIQGRWYFRGLCAHHRRRGGCGHSGIQ
ncbi:MAG: transposase [Nitrosopumilaceae archaeon]|nr:transposase [Nitrosopumilaceae archaeon]